MVVKLSICIPTYNRADYLVVTLDYIIEQILKEDRDIEIVISDNASSDKTSSLLQDYSSKYSFLRYYRNSKNLGFDLNLINAIENSTGEYVWTFSDDDIIQESALSYVLNLIEKFEPNYICLNYDQFTIVDSHVKKLKLSKEFKHFNHSVNEILSNLRAEQIFNIILARAGYLPINVFRRRCLNLNFVKSSIEMVTAWSHILMLAQTTENGKGLITPFVAVSQRSGNSSASPSVFLYQLPETFSFIFELFNVDNSFQLAFFRRLSNNLLSFLNIIYLIADLKLTNKKIEPQRISKKIIKRSTKFYLNYIMPLVPRFIITFITRLVRLYKGYGFNLGKYDLKERF